MYYLDGGQSRDTRMRNALLAACALHIAVAALVSFESTATPRNHPQIEVTLATRPSQESPEDARQIAQANQLGSGETSDLEAVTSTNNALPQQALHPRSAAPRQQQTDERANADLLSTVAAARRRVAMEETADEQLRSLTQGIDPEVARLDQQLASLEAELDEQTRAYSDRPRVRRLTAASTRQAEDAAYLLDWRRRLEAVGNKYYPEASVRYGLYGDLRLLVTIRKDGSLEEIRVLKSSGYAVLDEAAIKIVRLAAPYSPFPAELAATTDKLEIIRTWQFQQNELSSN